MRRTRKYFCARGVREVHHQAAAEAGAHGRVGQQRGLRGALRVHLQHRARAARQAAVQRLEKALQAPPRVRAAAVLPRPPDTQASAPGPNRPAARAADAAHALHAFPVARAWLGGLVAACLLRAPADAHLHQQGSHETHAHV